MGLGNYVLDGGPDPPMGRDSFEGGKGRPIVKYRDTLRSSVQKQQIPSCSRSPMGSGNFGGKGHLQ